MQYATLEKRVLAFQRDPANDSFDAVLGDVVRYQQQFNPALARYWAGRGFDAFRDNPADVPAVPTDVFRYVRLVSSEAEPTRVFRTSGTTHGARGEHWRLSLDAYVQGARDFFAEMTRLPPGLCGFIKLVFDPEVVTDSSLSFMVQQLEQTFATGCSPWLLHADGADIAGFDAALQTSDRPMVVFGTAFGFAHLLDNWRPKGRLPEGSVVVETGGFKGKSREVPREELYAWFTKALGCAPERCLSEYSMSELSSQLYSRGIELGRPTGLYAAPHWLRVRAVDPMTLQPLSPGETGLLRFDDLANTDSVAAIQTSDLGRVTADGVELIGRAPGATPRGCSLAVEEIIARRDTP
jgi:hypothetical protein